MKKKERNRKNVCQNKRNKMKNRRYLSTIKTFIKILAKKKTIEPENQEEKRSLRNFLYSVIDKAIKKKVLHKNNGARKKAKIAHLSSNF